MCEQLGSGAAPDCSQGIYHDYWFAVNGIDDTTKPKDAVTDPRELCGAAAAAVRAPVLVPRVRGDRRRARATESAADIERLCGGLEGLQRQACVTGAIVIGPPDPRNQLAICASLPERHRQSRPASAAPRCRTSSTIPTTCRST